MTVELRATHPKASASRTWRVLSLSNPRLIPAGEKAAWEIAAEQARERGEDIMGRKAAEEPTPPPTQD